jgi:cell division protein FtsX
VLTPDRLNAVVFGGFAAVALLISVVGVAGVLAFSVSGRTREFGIRMALGAQPSNILRGVLIQGLVIAGIGVGAGVVLASPPRFPNSCWLFTFRRMVAGSNKPISRGYFAPDLSPVSSYP